MEKDTQQELERLDQALQAAEEQPEYTEQTMSEEDYLWATEGIDPEEEYDDEYAEEFTDEGEEAEEFDETYYTEGDTAPQKRGHIWFPIVVLVLMAVGVGYIAWKYLSMLL